MELCDDQLNNRWSFSLSNPRADLPSDRGAFELVAESQPDFELWTSALKEICVPTPAVPPSVVSGSPMRQENQQKQPVAVAVGRGGGAHSQPALAGDGGFTTDR